MGGAGTRQGTYIGMMEHNVMKITDALGGQAEEFIYVSPTHITEQLAESNIFETR